MHCYSCNHLLVYEPGYYDKTYDYISAAYMPMHYNSAVRQLTLRYCQSADDAVPRQFSFTYNVLSMVIQNFFASVCVLSDEKLGMATYGR